MQSYFEVCGELKDMGYIVVKELWYVVENLMHMLYDKCAINMMNVAGHYGQVHLFVVHGVSKPQVVEK